MFAERYITRTDRKGRLTGLPVFPSNEDIEVILLRQENPLLQPLRQRALEQAYQEAGAEIDPAWDATLKDGLSDETW